MKLLYTIFFTSISIIGFSQPGNLNGQTINQEINWEIATNKAQGDSCGIYYNNYIGIHKTSIIREEPLRTGNVVESGHYNGRAQRFNAPQPIEVSGVEFYAYIKNNPTQDSLMVITTLNEYEVITDSLGAELARDTVYVVYHAFTIQLPNMSTQSHFDTPITLTNDYVVTIFTPTDDSLFIIANDPFTNAGEGENLGHALYDNTNYPSFQGWYSMLGDFSYDYDFLIAPLVKFDLHESFNVVNDTICPGIAGNACVSYTQQPIFLNTQYNSNNTTSTNSIIWNWGDGTYNTALTSACHTFNNSGLYMVNVQDTLFKWDYNNNHCLVDITNSIFALDSVIPNYTFVQTNSDVDFTNMTTGADSIWWDFGDGSTAGNDSLTSHFYNTIGTYDVWLHAINDCTEDSIMYQITTDNIGIENSEFISKLKIYPNPTNSTVSISNLPTNSTVEIFNLMGQKVDFVKNANILDVSNLSNGTYFVTIKSSAISVTKKIVVKH